ncbi:MAG: hypothetical protein JXR45_16975 [Deltaproteobacteria bacterium]|nr:hypothetical protein [Deltaproteobacteria bacterium]
MTATNILLGSGIALAAAGTVMFIYSKKKKREDSQQVSAVLGPDGIGVSATWDF